MVDSNLASFSADTLFYRRSNSSMVDSNVLYHSKHQLKSIGGSNSSMVDSNKTPLRRHIIPCVVQIPLWSIVTDSRLVNTHHISSVQIPLWSIVTDASNGPPCKVLLSLFKFLYGR